MVIKDPTELGSHAVAYYSSLYISKLPCIQMGIIDRVVPQLVMGGENDV